MGSEGISFSWLHSGCAFVTAAFGLHYSYSWDSLPNSLGFIWLHLLQACLAPVLWIPMVKSGWASQFGLAEMTITCRASYVDWGQDVPRSASALCMTGAQSWIQSRGNDSIVGRNLNMEFAKVIMTKMRRYRGADGTITWNMASKRNLGKVKRYNVALRKRKKLRWTKMTGMSRWTGQGCSTGTYLLIDAPVRGWLMHRNMWAYSWDEAEHSAIAIVIRLIGWIILKRKGREESWRV